MRHSASMCYTWLDSACVIKARTFSIWRWTTLNWGLHRLRLLHGSIITPIVLWGVIIYPRRNIKGALTNCQVMACMSDSIPLFYVDVAYPCLKTLRPKQNGRHFADDTFKRIFANENVRILIEISLKFVPEGPINNIPALVQIMAWRRPGDKPLSEPMMVCLLTHICVTRPQWVNLDAVLAKLH